MRPGPEGMWPAAGCSPLIVVKAIQNSLLTGIFQRTPGYCSGTATVHGYAFLKPFPALADTQSTVQPACFIFGPAKGGNFMSVVTHDVVLKRKPGKRRRKGMAALRKLRRALARKKLEEMQDDELLKQQLYDVFADEEEGGA